MSEVLRVDGVTVARNGGHVLRDLRFTVRRGEICALMGTSGAGKTTALRTIAALQPFDAGEILVEQVRLLPGPVPAESRLAPLRRLVAMVFQGHALFEHLTALENVSLAPVHARGRPRAEVASAARELLESVGVGARAAAYPRELSGGEAQRVAIARALALDPLVLLLDEPTAALDPARRGALGATLRRLRGDGRALLLATHDAEFARAAADRVLILAGGEIVEEGTPDRVLDRPAHPATRHLLRAGLADNPDPSHTQRRTS